MSATKYRRRIWSSVWHFCANCQHWPLRFVFERVRHVAPTYGTLCDECQSKRQRGECYAGTPSAKAGASQITLLWSIVSAILVSVWVPVAFVAQTVVNVDVALILTALTPIIMALGVLYQIVKKTKASLDEVHTLVDGSYTRGREEKLFEMQLYRASLSRQVQDKSAPEDIALLDDLNKRIAALETEIKARDATAATLPSSSAPKPEEK